MITQNNTRQDKTLGGVQSQQSQQNDEITSRGNSRSGEDKTAETIQTIESVREELKERLKIFRKRSKEDGRNVLWWTEFNKAESRLEGFNLGVSLGEKKGKEDALKDEIEFLNKLRDFNVNRTTIEDNINGRIMQLKEKIGVKS